MAVEHARLSFKDKTCSIEFQFQAAHEQVYMFVDGINCEGETVTCLQWDETNRLMIGDGCHVEVSDAAMPTIRKLKHMIVSLRLSTTLWVEMGADGKEIVSMPDTPSGEMSVLLQSTPALPAHLGNGGSKPFGSAASAPPPPYHAAHAGGAQMVMPIVTPEALLEFYQAHAPGTKTMENCISFCNLKQQDLQSALLEKYGKLPTLVEGATGFSTDDDSGEDM
jgi:hypothetical protein